MQPVFAQLDVLIQEKRPPRWLPFNDDPMVQQKRKNICIELRIMHVATLLLAVLAATCALSFIGCGLLVPLTSGHLISGCIKLAAGIALGLFAYDLNNLREIVFQTSTIFEEYIHLNKIDRITDDTQLSWKVQTAALKNSYKKVFLVHNLLDTVWPLTSRDSIQ